VGAELPGEDKMLAEPHISPRVNIPQLVIRILLLIKKINQGDKLKIYEFSKKNHASLFCC
jgi:hypothetical protein